MPVDSTLGQLGDLALPLAPADFDTTFAPADPVRSRLASLFRTAITYELTETWDKINLTLATGHALKGKPSIADTLELPPSQWAITQRKTDFPLLCVFRFGARTWSEHTIEIDRAEQTWRLVYILPPLDVGDLHKFADVTNAIVAIVRRVVRERGHKTFEGGALQFFPGTGGLGMMRLVSDETSPAQFAEGADAPLYHALTITLAGTEYATDDPDEFPSIEGVDFSLSIGDGTGVVPELITAWSDVDS